MSSWPYREPECRKAGEPSLEVEIEARVRELGDGFTVRRLLPMVSRRMVGPFIFVDHMGPVQLAAGAGLDVRPHPHINLSTVTYLFEGEVLHRDSIGSEQVIAPGAVNWMNAGSGIVHSERTPVAARSGGPRVHGMQLWVALPTAHEEDTPSFEHHPAVSIPIVERSGARLSVLAGSAFGAKSPVRVHSPLFYVQAELERNARLSLPDEFAGRAAYVVTGAISVDGKPHKEGTMVVFRSGAPARIAALEAARVMLLGGAPLDGERHIWWNFVSSSKERIERAKDEWRAQRFAKIPGDDHEYIPLPSSR